MPRIDKGSRTPARNRRQNQRDAIGLGTEFGNGLTYDPDSGTVSLNLDVDPALVFDGDGALSVQLQADGGLQKDTDGLGIKLDPTPGTGLSSGLALAADGLAINLAASSGLALPAGGLSVIAPEGGFAVTAVQTGAYTAAAGELVRCDPSGGTFAVTLPTAAGITGRQIIIKNTTSDTTTIDITPDGSETIDGAAGVTITTAYGFVRLVSDGANWMAA